MSTGTKVALEVGTLAAGFAGARSGLFGKNAQSWSKNLFKSATTAPKGTTSNTTTPITSTSSTNIGGASTASIEADEKKAAEVVKMKTSTQEQMNVTKKNGELTVSAQRGRDANQAYIEESGWGMYSNNNYYPEGVIEYFT